MADRQLDEIILSMLTLSSFVKEKEEFGLETQDGILDEPMLDDRSVHSCLLTT